MGSRSKYRAAGLLSGFGRGLSQVAERRYQRERDDAEALRKQSLMEMGWDREDQRTAEQREHDAAVLAEQREYDEGNVASYQDIVDEDGNPVKRGYNKRGEKVVDAERAPKTTEVDKTGTKKYDSPLYRDARNMLFDDAFVKYADTIKQKTGKDLDISQFMITMDDGTTKFNKTALKAKLKEMKVDSALAEDLHQELNQKESLLETNLQSGELGPRQAVEMTKEQYGKVDKGVQGKRDEAAIKKIAKEYGVGEDVVTAMKTLQPGDPKVKKMTERFMQNPDAENPELMALMKINPAVYQEIIKGAGKTAEDRALQEKIDNTEYSGYAGEDY